MAHRTPSGRSSDAWKSFERAIAELYVSAGFVQAHRVSRGADVGSSDTDVKVPEVPALQLDCKYKVKGWSIMSLFEEVEAKYVKKGSQDFLVLPIKSGGKQGSLSVIRSEILAELIAHKYLGETGSAGFCCPKCSSQQLETVGNHAGRAQIRCNNCNFEFDISAKDALREAPKRRLVPKAAA